MFFLPRENEVPGYCNVFLALFYGNLSNLERDREIEGWESICSSVLDTTSQNDQSAFNGLFKALAMTDGSLPLTIIVAANRDIIYGFYLLSTTSSLIVSPPAADADRA